MRTIFLLVIFNDLVVIENINPLRAIQRSLVQSLVGPVETESLYVVPLVVLDPIRKQVFPFVSIPNGPLKEICVVVVLPSVQMYVSVDACWRTMKTKTKTTMTMTMTMRRRNVGVAVEDKDEDEDEDEDEDVVDVMVDDVGLN